MAHTLDDASYHSQKKAVWKATLIMGIVTIAEVAIAVTWPEGWPRLLLNLLFIFMSVAKAFFIMGEFMHLKYESRALILSVLMPFLFLVWGIIAFILEGDSWGAMRAFWE